MSKHRHKYGPWKMHNPTDKTDEEFRKSLKLPPFWLQKCECGYENWIRTSKRPLASFSFNQMWKARRL